MTYKTHNEVQIDVNRTSLKAYLNCDYEQIVELFGEPLCWTEDKVDWEWLIDLGNGHVATIYNWKNGPGYGVDAQPWDITRWHIGARSEAAAFAVQAIVEGSDWEIFVA